MLYKAGEAGQTSWIVVSAMLCSSTNDPAVCYAASGGNASGYNLVHPSMSYANSGSGGGSGGGGSGGSGCGSVALLAHHHHDYGYPRPEVTGSGPFVQDLDCSIHSSAVAAVAAAAAAAAAISTYHQQHPANPGSSAVSSSAIHPPKKFWDHPAQGTHPLAKKSDSAGAKASQNNRLENTLSPFSLESKWVPGTGYLTRRVDDDGGPSLLFCPLDVRQSGRKHETRALDEKKQLPK